MRQLWRHNFVGIRQTPTPLIFGRMVIRRKLSKCHSVLTPYLANIPFNHTPQLSSGGLSLQRDKY